MARGAENLAEQDCSFTLSCPPPRLNRGLNIQCILLVQSFRWPRCSRGKRLLPVSATEADIALVPADFDLRAFGEHLALFGNAHHHGGFTTAVADGFNFFENMIQSERLVLCTFSVSEGNKLSE